MADNCQFLGGLGTQVDASDVNGGGGLHSKVSLAQGGYPTLVEMESYMDANGGPLYTATAASFTGVGPFEERITKAGEFSAACVGLYAYISSATGGWVHLVLITAADVNSITFSKVAEAPQTDVVVNVGGAWNTMQALITNAPNPDVNSETACFLGQNETLTASLTNFNTLDGVLASNSRVRLSGYGVYPGDGVPVVFTGNGALNDHGWVSDNIYNVDHEHIRMTDFGVGNTKHGWKLGVTTVCTNCTWTNCTGDNNTGAGFTTLTLRGCAFINPKSHDNAVLGMIFKDNVAVINPLIYGNGGNGIKANAAATRVFVYGGTIDGNGSEGVLVDNAGAEVILLNTIVSNSGDENLKAGTGSILAVNCNLFNPGSTDDYIDGGGNLSVDPMFADAGNGDFRLKPESGLWNKGMPTLDGGYSTMGTWERMQTPHKLDLAGL